MPLASRAEIFHPDVMPSPSSRAHPVARFRTALLVTGSVLALGPRVAAQSGDSGFPRTDDRMGPSMPTIRNADRLPVFFPPSPPPMGRPPAPSPSGSRLIAPPELAQHVSEFYYPALGSRLVTRTLSDKLRAQVEAYRTAKLAAQNELESELERLRGAEPDTRRTALATLARRQAPQLAQLEKDAEQLRRDLITSDYNWSALRQWHLSDKQRRGFSPIEIAQVMRAYAFYQNNLLPAQRRLLREISIELLFAGENTTAATAAQPYVFFAPEPARVLFPDDLPSDVAARLARYQTRKSALKKELYDAVYASDGATLAFLRGTPLRSIAEKQAKDLAELETLAEEIRVGLAAAPPPRAERSPLPPDLDAQVGALIASYQAAQREASRKIDEIIARSRDLPLQASYRFDGENLKFVVVPTRSGRGGFGGPGGGTPGGGRGPAPLDPRVEAVRNEISAIVDTYGRRVADIFNEREMIRAEIGRLRSLEKGGDIDRLLFAAMRIANQRNADRQFSDYRAVVFEPGFSPEQRRLLFDRVVEKLELPLPRGELQPTVLADSW